MKIIIHTIPHSAQRYNTVGDWQILRDPEGTVIHITVSEMPLSERLSDRSFMEALVGLHELIEALWCCRHGVTQDAVDHFDTVEWPKIVKEFPSAAGTEPGDHPHAPYHAGHQHAENVERMVAAQLDISWPLYEQELARVGK